MTFSLEMLCWWQHTCTGMQHRPKQRACLPPPAAVSNPHGFRGLVTVKLDAAGETPGAALTVPVTMCAFAAHARLRGSPKKLRLQELCRSPPISPSPATQGTWTPWAAPARV